MDLHLRRTLGLLLPKLLLERLSGPLAILIPLLLVYQGVGGFQVELLLHFLIGRILLVCRVLFTFLLLSCLVESFENDVGELLLHEGDVDIFEDAGGLCLNDTYIMDSTRTDSYDFPVHQGFDELGCVSDGFDTVVIC